MNNKCLTDLADMLIDHIIHIGYDHYHDYSEEHLRDVLNIVEGSDVMILQSYHRRGYALALEPYGVKDHICVLRIG